MSERRQNKKWRFQGREQERLLRSGRWEEQQQEVTEAFGSFQTVATGAFLTAGRTAAHAADTRLVTAWRTTEGNFNCNKAKTN